MTCLVYFGINHPTSTVDDIAHLGLPHISEIIWLLPLLPYWNPNGKSYENPNPVHLPTPEAWRKWCNCDASTPLDSLKVTNPKPRCLWQPTDASSGMNSVLDGLTSNVHSLLYVLYITRLYIYITISRCRSTDAWQQKLILLTSWSTCVFGKHVKVKRSHALACVITYRCCPYPTACFPALAGRSWTPQKMCSHSQRVLHHHTLPLRLSIHHHLSRGIQWGFSSLLFQIILLFKTVWPVCPS